MKTQHILTITAMAALGLCLVLAFSKRLTKNLKTKETMSHIFSFLVFIAIALVAVTQLLSEKENMTAGGDWEIGTVETASMPNDGAKTGGKKVSMGQMGVGNDPPVCCNSPCGSASTDCANNPVPRPPTLPKIYTWGGGTCTQTTCEGNASDIHGIKSQYRNALPPHGACYDCG